MQFASIHVDDEASSAASYDGSRWLPLNQVDGRIQGDLLNYINNWQFAIPIDQICEALESAPEGAHILNPNFAPPYQRPRKIWGIGLNYAEHATDLSAEHPAEPASLIKGDHTIVGHQSRVIVPQQSQRVTAEAELGLVIGRTCNNVGEDEALEYVFGAYPILDQTAEDILKKNPRYLTRSKNFPTFFSFGPVVIPLSDLLADVRLGDLEVSTKLNGSVFSHNYVRNMKHSPAKLVSLHSRMMPLFPGDILSTSTPGAVVIGDGDTVEATLTGMPTLSNYVVDSKLHRGQ